MRCKACNEIIDENSIQDEVYVEYNLFIDSGLCQDCYTVESSYLIDLDVDDKLN